MNVLILYTELAAYTIASVSALAEKGANIHLVRWPVNAEAPFEFDFGGKIKVYDRKKYTSQSLKQLTDEIAPDIILCSGWNDKGYTSVCRKWCSEIPVVLAMDNKWHGGIKQHLARVISAFTIRKTFSHCWVPGEAQKEYALKLGFDQGKIKTGFYTCDTEHFNEIYHRQREGKQKKFPHVIIYAGRYYDFKGVNELWSEFIQFKEESDNDWKLVCLGTGDVHPVEHPDIEHKGFVQPRDMEELMKLTGVFILPSRFEPWAVVVQEFAAAGFPLLLSEEVGAREAFLETGRNGYTFTANQQGAIRAILKQITSRSDEQLLEMGAHSNVLALRNSPDRWAETLLSFRG